MSNKKRGAAHEEQKAALKDFRKNPYARFHNAFALMSVIPFLVLFYIIVAKLFSINILIGSIGFLVFLAIFITIIGYLLTHDILHGLVSHIMQLRQHDKSRSKFIASVFHELVNPLFMIRGSIENMTGGIYGTITDKQKEILHLCQNVTGRMSRLTSSLMDMHKIEAGVVDIHRTSFDLQEMLEKQEKEFEIRLKGKGIKIEKQIHGENFHLWADKDKISQVINNLLGNAAKYTPDNCRINVLLSRETDIVKLVIHNTGSHIPQHELENIFDKYKRLHSSEDGAGLGLAIVKDIIDLHRGSIWAESHPETGTRFIVTLPCNLRKKRA
ncbi:MAG: HAMP domain-containing histidine kinase [Candidatus Omnitrophica bacterium]|nr:HAMP domain-containing histidine kinase [Candidatus Omnitrophota bacterium]